MRAHWTQSCTATLSVIQAQGSLASGQWLPQGLWVWKLSIAYMSSRPRVVYSRVHQSNRDYREVSYGSRARNLYKYTSNT